MLGEMLADLSTLLSSLHTAIVLERRVTGGDADVLHDVSSRQLVQKDTRMAAPSGPLIHLRPHRRHVHAVLHARAGGQDGAAIAGKFVHCHDELCGKGE